MRTLLLSAVFAVAAFGQAPAAPARPVCDGNMATIRVSEIPKTGSLEGFMKAVAAHAEWYKSHGLEDKIFAARVVVRDEATRGQKYSETQVLTYHVSPAVYKPGPAHDEAYDAFVKLYKENSEIKQTYNVCMPKGTLK
jgi:hypothetical protein